MKRTLRLVNPLPRTLAHYQRELSDVLVAAGAAVTTQHSPSAEVAGSPVRRLWVGLRLAVARRLRPYAGWVVVLWPVFGLADPLSWPRQSARRRTFLVVHDPQPLRRQVGMGPRATRLGGRAARRRVTTVVHGESARAALLLVGWPEPVVLPHPMLAPTAQPDGSRQGLLVLGQWKPARAMDPLTTLSLDQRWDGLRSVRGRGWPQVTGWDVDARFLSEAEVTAALSSAECLVLPYSLYFQSGVAVRALESMTPVVGERHPFLEDLLGPDWPGLVDDGDWAAAVARAVLVPGPDLDALRWRAWDRCVAAWQGWSGSTDGAPPG